MSSRGSAVEQKLVSSKNSIAFGSDARDSGAASARTTPCLLRTGSMKPTIEFHILDYLRFGEQESVESSNWLSVDEAAWKRGLGFTDTAGLSLHLRDRLMGRNDFGKLPASIQIELEQRHSDNVQRTSFMLQEFVELNRRLQACRTFAIST